MVAAARPLAVAGGNNWRGGGESTAGTVAAGVVTVAVSGRASQPVLRSAGSAPRLHGGGYYNDPYYYGDDSYYDEPSVAVVPDSGGDPVGLLRAALQVLQSGLGHVSRL